AAWINRRDSIVTFVFRTAARLGLQAYFSCYSHSDHENTRFTATRRKHLEQRKPFHGMDGCRPQPEGHRRSARGRQADAWRRLSIRHRLHIRFETRDSNTLAVAR